jgi:hypothetical protein
MISWEASEGRERQNSKVYFPEEIGWGASQLLWCLGWEWDAEWDLFEKGESTMALKKKKNSAEHT